MNKLAKYFSSDSVSKIIDITDLLDAFEQAISFFIEHVNNVRNDKDDWFPERYDDTPLELLQEFISGTAEHTFMLCNSCAANRLIKLRSLVQTNNFRSALYEAIYEWQKYFAEVRSNNALPEYCASYIHEMIKSIEYEKEYLLFNQRKETSQFKIYLASEQATHIIMQWEKNKEDGLDELVNNSNYDQENTHNILPCDIYVTSSLRAAEIGLVWMEKVYQEASPHEKIIYQKKQGPPKKGQISQGEYLKKLYKRFVDEKKVLISISYFERAILRPFKKRIMDKLNG
jgi:hypothetical protein